ncbi:hypothetical protein HanRHA438_Chr08g0357481 [Helianthus annuus]|nr:hypothetical protein HanRHA438_Chr08g0357481 [Helianthus annuus]
MGFGWMESRRRISFYKGALQLAATFLLKSEPTPGKYTSRYLVPGQAPVPAPYSHPPQLK